MRDLVLGMALFVTLMLAAAMPGLTSPRTPSAAAPTPRAQSASPIVSGPGFTVCTADPTWKRPSEAEQRAYLEGDRRFDGAWEAAGTPGHERFRAPAVLYDGKSASGLSWIVQLTGLWNVWHDPATRPRTCWTEQPQVFLFGYEALSYDAQDPSVAVLRVRPASGYRMVVLTGPVRPAIDLVADRKLDHLVVPEAWLTPFP